MNNGFINYDESCSETESDYSESDRSSRQSEGASNNGSDYKQNPEFLLQ